MDNRIRVSMLHPCRRPRARGRLPTLAFGNFARGLRMYDFFRYANRPGDFRRDFLAFGDPNNTARLTATFLFGMAFYLYREEIRYSHYTAAAAAVLLIASANFPAITELAMATLGGYLIFWFALRFRPSRISLWANETDLSYGIYLYAFPVQATLTFAISRWLSSLMLSLIALVISAIVAYFSWRFIEKPALRLAHPGRLADASLAVSKAARQPTPVG